MMKKFLLLLCVLFLAVSFVACDDEEVSTDSNSTISDNNNSNTGDENNNNSNTGDENNNNSNTGDENNNNNGNTNNDSNVNQADSIVLVSSASTINVGDKITITVKFNSVKQVKSIGLRPIYDEDVFELVSGRMLLSAPLSGFSSGIGVQAFDECIDLENQNIMQFTLKAKVSSNQEAVSCEVSVLGEGDKSIVVSQPSDLLISIK